MQSLFQASPQQVTADLDSFDFSSTTGNNQDIPYITNSCVLPMMVESSTAGLNKKSLAKKRGAAEISENEDGCDGSDTVSPVSSRSSNSRKASGRRVPTGYGSSSILDFVHDKSKHIPPVDTSTAHVQALTSSKGPAMCFDIVDAMKNIDNNEEFVSVASTSDDEEKKALHRARNRRHARNTRVRKQAYVEELKRTLFQMLREREEKKEVLAEEHRIRQGVMAEFLRMQTVKEPRVDRWNAILEDGVTMSMDESTSCSGAEEIMAENRRNYAFGDGSFFLKCPPDTFLMDGVNAVVDWSVTSTDQQKLFHGTCRVSFNPHSNKLSSIVIRRNL